MRVVVVTMALAGLCAGANAEARLPRGRELIRLTVGQSRTISISGTITRVQVLNPSIADVAHHDTRSVTIVGVDGGATEFLVTTARGTFKYAVVVTKVEVGRLYKMVRSFLGRIENIYPRLIGDTVILSGAALTADDYGRAQRAVKLFGDKVLNFVRFKPSAVEQVNQILRRSGLTEVRARLVGGTVFLEGAVGSASEMEKVKAILRTYGLNVENLVKIGGGKQILIDVYFVEMRTSGLERIGVTWPATFGAGSSQESIGTVDVRVPIRPAGGTTAALNISAALSPAQVALNLLFSSGKARLLAQPRLVCGSGKSAEFLVGGEAPVVQITDNVVHIDYKPFGIRLNVQPTADSLGNVESTILAEVSAPDDSLARLGVPGFRTRRFNTDVTVKAGASIVLSGLFNSSEEKSISKVPLLGHIPILGELFKSRQFQQQKTTLVVFVTPRVVSSQHPWVIKTIRDIQKLYTDYEDEVGWQLLD